MAWLVSILISGIAGAEPLVTEVGKVRQSLSRGDFDDAVRMIQLTVSGAPYTNEIVDAQSVSELLYYQGLLPRMMGAERPSDLDLWREALIVYPDLQWAKDLLDDRDQHAVFEAIRGEVSQRVAVASGVPAQRGAAKMYVDGVEHADNEAVRSGRHLVQVACPDGEVVGRWTRFEAPVPWLSMCTSAIDLTVVPAADEEEDDGFGEMDNPRAGPDPLPISMVPAPKVESFAERWKTKLIVGAGSSAVVSGALYAAALSNRSKYDALGAESVESQAELDALRDKTNGQVGLSVAFAGVGVGLATVAGFSGRW